MIYLYEGFLSTVDNYCPIQSESWPSDELRYLQNWPNKINQVHVVKRPQPINVFATTLH